MQSVPGTHSRLSKFFYQELIPRVGEKLGNQLRTKISTMIERTVCQQLSALLPAVPKSEIRASLDVVQMDWIASLERKMAGMIEKVADTITTPLLSHLQVFIEKRVFAQVQSVKNSKPPDTGVLVETVRTKVERKFPLHPRSSPYGAQLGYPLKDTLEELTPESGQAAVASPSKNYPTGMGKQPVSGRKPP